MNRAFGTVVAAILAIVGLGFGGRAYAHRAMNARAVTPKTLGSATPANEGIPFSRVAVETGDRTLIGWWVRARADSGKTPPALLFLHGNRSSISDYVALQKFLYRQGISSLVFDYSGFGASGGSASLTNAVADATSAARMFADSAGPSARKTAMGSALGATVLLQAIDGVQSFVNGVVIEGVTASVKESAIRDGRLPKLVAPLVTDIGDNVAAAHKVKVPLLAVHSYADERFPIEDAQRVVDAVNTQTALVRHWRKGHSALLASSKTCDWDPVLRFVREGSLPAAKLDTVDQCVVAARMAAAIKSEVTPAGATNSNTKAPAANKTTGTKTAGTKTAAAKAPTGTKTGSTATKAAISKAAATKAPSTRTGTKTPATKATSTKTTSTRTTSTKTTSTKKSPSSATSPTTVKP